MQEYIQEINNKIRYLDEILSTDLSPENLEKIPEILNTIILNYLKIKEYIYLIINHNFKNSILTSKSIEEKLILLDLEILNLQQDIINSVNFVKEIRKNYKTDNILKLKLEEIKENKKKIMYFIQNLTSLILDLIEILEEFERSKLVANYED